MNLFNFPIKRPVTIMMGMIMVLVLGALSWSRMPLDLMPDISFPNLLVFVRYQGAGPEEIEERLGKVLEAAIKTTSNIKNVKVTAQEEMCFVNAEFNWGTDLDAASADLREKIAMVRDVLPDDIDEPVVIRIDFQDLPVVFLHVDDPSGKRNLYDLGNIAKDLIAPALERQPGVASAQTLGGLYREVQVNMDQDALKQYGLSSTDIMQSIAYNNLDLTTGYVDEPPFRFRVKGKSQFNSIEEIQDLVVGFGVNQVQAQQVAMADMLRPFPDPLAGSGARSPIRLKDVAEVIDTFKQRQGLVRVVYPEEGASEGIGMAVMKETDANMVEVAKTVKKALVEIQAGLPEGVKVGISFDLSEIILDSLTALANSALEGGILAALVIFLFLFRVRPTLIVVISIPLSLLASFVAMYFSGYTLNIMTLGAMVIAVGKLVDDSIVVLENIVRHQAMGEPPLEAAEKGFQEVAVAVTAATLVAVIIFLPLAFTQGLSAQLFRTFAGTVFFALIGSLIVSFTVVPMLCSRFLRMPAPKAGKKSIPVFQTLQNIYARLLAWALDHWGMVLTFSAFILILTVEMVALMGLQGRFEFVPRLVGHLYRAEIKLPPGSLIEETDAVMMKITNIHLEKLDDFVSLFMVVGQSGDPARAAFTGGEQGMNQGEFNIKMKKKVEGRHTTEEELRKIWDDFAAQHPNADISFQQSGSLQFTNVKPILIKIFGDDFEVMRGIADRIKTRVEKVAGTRDVTTSLEQGVPEFSYEFNRDKLGQYRIPTALALTSVRIALGGQMANIYREAGKEYDITVRVKEDQRSNFQVVGDIILASPLGFNVPLRDVAEFKFGEGPLEIKRENSKRMITVDANKTERPLGQIVTDIQESLRDLEGTLPEGYSYEFGGETKDLAEAFIDLALMFVAALILVYLILASLYESLIHPITIMIAIPLAFTGSIALLFVTGTPFGVTAFIGMIMLVGIVATNSIVLMDFILEFKHQGLSDREAIIEAGQTRLRPILMTALTTLFGVVPIALGRAEGMELQQPLGIVIVGGLISSTILTLVIIPVFFKLFQDFSEDMKNLLRPSRKLKPPLPPNPPI